MKDLKTVLLIALVVLLGYFIYFYDRTFIWDGNTDFLTDDDEPFGCLYFDKMAEATLPNGYSYYEGNPRNLLENGEKLSLLLLFDYLYLYSEMEEFLDSFVVSGNKVMFVVDSYNNYGESDFLSFDVEDQDYFQKEYLRDDLLGNTNKVHVTIGNEKFDFPESLMLSYLQYNKTDWKVYAKADRVYGADSTSFYPISITRSYGKGQIYVVANPLLFTNYGVLDRNISRYLGMQLGMIADNKVVRLSNNASVGRTLDWGDGEYYNKGSNTLSPLSYFFSKQPLRWAMYTLLLGVCLFMFFTARRRQRVIPVVKSPENKNLEFVKLLGTIYCRRHDNLDLLKKKHTYFKEELRRRMMIDLDDAVSERGNVIALSQKTGLDEKFVANTLGELRTLTSADDGIISNAQLMKCVHNIDKIINNI